MAKLFWIILAIAVILGIILIFAYYYNPDTNIENDANENSSPFFMNDRKTPHWVSNTPEHKAVLAAAPLNVVVNFDNNLTNDSIMMIIHHDRDFGTGRVIINSNNLLRSMDEKAPDGIYTVQYRACWPDKSCDDGNFQFIIKQD
jgi:methionine-rich copper-binding protein CopC